MTRRDYTVCPNCLTYLAKPGHALCTECEMVRDERRGESKQGEQDKAKK